ncbi:MAG: hypothetical protein DRI34_10340 [Deltaproteobacteria bacterium]|nr:MAG: hypothetical protein DRI34_10340 [Deltaproteobacteria bacterium]
MVHMEKRTWATLLAIAFLAASCGGGRQQQRGQAGTDDTGPARAGATNRQAESSPPPAGVVAEAPPEAPAAAPQPVSGPAGSSGLVDLAQARMLLKKNRFDELLDVFQPGDVDKLTVPERRQLADIFAEAAGRLRSRHKDVSYASLFCERGLMLAPRHQPLLRLQVRNYLHPELKLFGGAEELSEKLIAIDPNDQVNQLLRGRAAFEQGEWELAIKWLEKAARAGRQHSGKQVQEAWHLLDLARGKAQEVKSALSMTRELERRLKLTRARLRELSRQQEQVEARENARLAGGDIVLYMTRWCGYCKKTRQLLDSLGVPYQAKDIEDDNRAREELMKEAVRQGVEITGVPVVRIGNHLVRGYNPQRIRQLVQQLK